MQVEHTNQTERTQTPHADSDARVDQDRTAAPHQHTRLGQQHYYAQDDRGRSR